MSAERVIALLNEAIALLSGTVNYPAGPQGAAARYLEQNPDVAAHVYFGKHPLEHWQLHGQAEGRRWPAVPVLNPENDPPKPYVPPPMVDTPGGRRFPAPEQNENAMGYFQRVGIHLGKQLEWSQRGGTLFLGTDHLVPKTVPYPEGYAAYKADRANWPAMAEGFWFPAEQAADPGWQQVHDRMKEQRVERPAVPPLGEEPL